MVLEKLTPAERLAFVLHDMFDVPFDEIAPAVDRSPAAARQLASRRVQQQAPIPDAGLGRQREVVDAFLVASREGDFGALLEVLHPDVTLRADAGTTPTATSREVHGARAVAELALAFSQVARFSQPAIVNGTVGLVTVPDGELVSVMGFTIKGGRISRDRHPRRCRSPRPTQPRSSRRLRFLEKRQSRYGIRAVLMANVLVVRSLT